MNSDNVNTLRSILEARKERHITTRDTLDAGPLKSSYIVKLLKTSKKHGNLKGANNELSHVINMIPTESPSLKPA